MIIKLPFPDRKLSPNARLHWASLANAKRAYRKACYLKAVEQGVTPTKAEKLHLIITFYPPTRRNYDADNLLARMKSGLDGLADALEFNDKNWRISFDKSETIGGFVEVQIEEVSSASSI